MRFIVGAQLPPALARRLVGRGLQAEHVADVNLAGASDAAIWDYAKSNSAVIITKDGDFAQRKSFGAKDPKVIWVRFPNARGRQIIAWFDQAVPMILSELAWGEDLIGLV